jgi:hypothetical protein
VAYFYAFAVLLLYLAQHCFATTVVVIRTPRYLVVGADSLVVNWHSPGSPGGFYTCKLHKQHSMLFVIQGMGIVHRKSKFSAEELARQAISSSHSLKEAAVRFAQTSSSPYARVMADLRIQDPNAWSLVAQHHGTGIPLIAVFFGFEKGVPKYVIAGLRVNQGETLTVSADVASCPGDACKGLRESAIVIGQSEAAYRRVGSDDQLSLAKFRHERGDLRAVETIIAIEERAAPDSVGGPIRIVTLDTEGERWIPASAACR